MSVLAQESGLTIAKLTPTIGAEATGIDLTRPVDARTRQRLYDALVENIALVIRDQHFTPAQYLAAVELFGEAMEDQDKRFRLPEVPKVRAVDSLHKDSTGKRFKVGARWHSDHTNQLRPPKFTALYGVELPETGGATNIANMRAAYEALPADMKARVKDMRTVNLYVSSGVKNPNPDRLAAQLEEKPEAVEQPLVRTNPDNGAKALYFHPSKVENIVGMTPADSQVFLDDLLARAIKPEFIYAHKWRKGDMLIWDNRQAMHKAGFDYDAVKQRRLLYRAMVRGERPV
jgi:alpha-ketoglutarate-dependent taurine dioxygenase